MEHHEREDVTELLQAWNAGDAKALDRVVELVYDELRGLARYYISKERNNHTLQPTALAHEAYMRLVKQTDVQWQNRAHFLGIAARMMRRILIDHARHHLYLKRGGGAVRVSLGGIDGLPQKDVELLALEDALKELEALDPVQVKIVELRYFGGLTIPETAEVLGITERQIKQEWNTAKAWLYRQITRDADNE